MVEQGDIIKINMNPQLGSEQAGYRPAIVVSNNRLNSVSKVVIVCPITSTIRNYPTHIKLVPGMATRGEVMCEQIKALDLTVRPFTFIEKAPDDIMTEVSETLKYVIEFS